MTPRPIRTINTNQVTKFIATVRFLKVYAALFLFFLEPPSSTLPASYSIFFAVCFLTFFVVSLASPSASPLAVGALGAAAIGPPGVLCSAEGATLHHACSWPMALVWQDQW
jgi:hypothetical protein